MQASKRCVRCGEVKGAHKFYRKKGANLGLSPRCKPCHEAWRRERDPLLNIKASLALRKREAKKRGIPFSLSLLDLLPLPAVCPVFGQPLTVGPSGGHDFSPSIDRIRPELGYVPGNVIVISMKANRIKNSATPEEMRQVASFFERLR